MTEDQKKELKALLIASKAKVSVAESLTSGLIQNFFGSISGATSFYEGGITTYTIPHKKAHLGVNEKYFLKDNENDSEREDAVSERIAKEMSLGVCNLFNSNIGIATTGYAEPNVDKQVEIPYAFIAIYFKATDTSIVEKVIGENLSRNEMRQFATQNVIELLLEKLTAEN